MGKLKDLSNQTFGYLTVLPKHYKKNGKTYWECICKCGKKVSVYSYHLTSGHTKSCGCYQKERAQQHMSEMSAKNFKNLKGEIFGFLEILEKTDERKDGSVVWLCKCLKCNNICKADQHSLQKGNKISCGCIQSKGEETIIKLLNSNNISFEQQKVFDSCKFESGFKAKFDFYVDNKYLIEYDGKQHFYNTGWGILEETQKRDKIKTQWCKNNNIPLIRIPYTHLKELCIEDLKLETSKFIV